MAFLPGPVLVIAGFALYMLTNTWLGRFRRVPWEFLAISALGLVVSLASAVLRPGLDTGIGAGVSVALFAFLIWFFFRFSMYAPREDRPRVGDRFPEFRLPTSDGAVLDFVAPSGKRRLLIFYRGSW